MRILVIGGDGYCGWPISLRLSSQGHEVTIVDNCTRRKIAEQLNAPSLTPIKSIEDRVSAWNEISMNSLTYRNLDVSQDLLELAHIMAEHNPDCIVHLAAQRSAPYSMVSAESGNYTIQSNLVTANSVLHAAASQKRAIRFIHIGSIGSYGYFPRGYSIPEKPLTMNFVDPGGNNCSVLAKPPSKPSSIYHISKLQLQALLDYYAANSMLEIYDLYQGIVWGTETIETNIDESLCNRFDYDQYYGTVINRFLIQAALGRSLTVHGAGTQTRGIIHISDTVNCVSSAIHGRFTGAGAVQVLHQVSETIEVREIANLVSRETGSKIQFLENPRTEPEANDFVLELSGFSGMGLELLQLKSELLNEIGQTISKYRNRINEDVIDISHVWSRNTDRKVG